MKSKLAVMTFSDPGLLNNDLNQFGSAVSDNLPGDQLSDLNDIKNFIDSCEYLEGLNPVSTMIGNVNGIFSEIDKLVNGFDLSFPEFGVGNFGSLIDKLLDGIPGAPGGDKISELLAKADKLLNCLSSACAAQDPTYIGDLTQKSAELQQTYDDLGLIDDPLDPNYGKFDYDAMYNDLGMSTQEIDAINSVKSSVNGSKDDGMDAISKTTDAIKQAKKIGGLF
jgi:hypothetical protein